MCVFVCCLHVSFHVMPCTHVTGVTSRVTCLVLQCLLSYIGGVMSHVTSCHVTLKVMSRHGVQCDMSCHVVLSLPLQCMSLLSSHHDRCVQCSGTRFPSNSHSQGTSGVGTHPVITSCAVS